LKNVYQSIICNKQKRHPTSVQVELRQAINIGIKTMWETFEINMKEGRGKKDFMDCRKKIYIDYIWRG